MPCMSRYARSWTPGGTFFFTVVTGSRERLFVQARCRRWLKEAYAAIEAKRPFDTVAFCLLPDHLHCIWTLPEGDSDYPMWWKLIKERFTRIYLREEMFESRRNASKERRGERGVWQRRYWEHMVRDEEDLRRLCDYIHYNPVKHGLVRCAHEWPYSTLPRYVAQGIYPREWGCSCCAPTEVFGWMVDNAAASE